jgi:hypothetical protein
MNEHIQIKHRDRFNITEGTGESEKDQLEMSTDVIGSKKEKRNEG